MCVAYIAMQWDAVCLARAVSCGQKTGSDEGTASEKGFRRRSFPIELHRAPRAVTSVMGKACGCLCSLAFTA